MKGQHHVKNGFRILLALLAIASFVVFCIFIVEAAIKKRIDYAILSVFFSVISIFFVFAFWRVGKRIFCSCQDDRRDVYQSF